MNQAETPRTIELEEQRITTAILTGILPDEIVRIRRNTVRCYFPIKFFQCRSGPANLLPACIFFHSEPTEGSERG